MSLKRFAAGLLILLAGVPSVMASSKESASRPRFSWDTVPQWLIVRKATAFTGEESRILAAAPLVVFEKANGHRDAGNVEDGILRAARAVKAVDSKIVTLFYWNAVINYPGYLANDIFDKNKDAWALKKNGAVFLMVAEQGAYFHYGTGPDVFPGPGMDIWRNDIYDELCRPLGKPIGPALVHGYTYTRQFEHLDVRLDLERRETTYEWR